MAIQDGDGQIKTRSQAVAEQVLQRHDETHLWVDLTLGMTKLQKEEYVWQQAIQATAQANANGLNRSNNFEDIHSVNPVEGCPNDGTAFTKTRNVSLGETAYDVVLQSNKSDLEDVFHNPYSDDEDTNRMNLEMDKVHRQMGRTMPCPRSSLSKEGGSNSNSAASDREEGQNAMMGSNEEASGSAGGGEDKTGHAVLTQDLAKTPCKPWRQHHLRTKFTFLTDHWDLLR